MALSSDEIIKRELIDYLGAEIGNITARVFPEGSRDDQKAFEDGGLTFSFNNIKYGSCDLVYTQCENNEEIPVVAIEGTDCLNRGSSGNAQYQRFHHALGAVKNGIIGIYYLKSGNLKIQADLYAMAYHASILENGTYLIVQDLSVIKTILELLSKNNKKQLDTFLNTCLEDGYEIFKEKFKDRYKSDWNRFANQRSTIIKDRYIIKHSATSKRNIVDSGQRKGHITLGEMFLSKYYFIDKTMYYLFPRMTKNDLEYINNHKKNDKEWSILNKEPNVKLITIDDISNVPDEIKNGLYSIRDTPLKGEDLIQYKKYKKIIHDGLKNGDMQIRNLNQL